VPEEFSSRAIASEASLANASPPTDDEKLTTRGIGDALAAEHSDSLLSSKCVY
jgi:hypothetical protein